jgi:hypothetical protein
MRHLHGGRSSVLPAEESMTWPVGPSTVTCMAPSGLSKTIMMTLR